MKFRKVTHVIFDMDGTILETESIYQRILGGIANDWGQEYSHEIQLKILGTPEQDTAKIFLKELQIPLSTEEFLDVYHKRMHEELQHPTFMPGAEKLIRHLSKHKVPIAIATSASKFSYELKVKNHQEVFQLFHHVVCGTSDPEVKNGKPAPDIFLICASRFPDKPNPNDILVLEDAPNGIKGASAAGMLSVLIPERGLAEEHRKQADLVLNSLEEFQPELFGLPPFDD
ncbi:pseudouridine-5'-phosphatase-like [Sitophilus oryzae]|uniref:Pseudouridine-5'-phosphatase-like n=1 Tax=Sitophilus oryzae TaxID=7048 RepID=A0A6J2Y2G7_SITOR|nr:pseudouridine-5'-phosphatase-like [Sitophilus oryzae]